MVYSLLYSTRFYLLYSIIICYIAWYMHARCYSWSLTSTASAIVMPTGCLVSSRTGRSRSKASNSSMLNQDSRPVEQPRDSQSHLADLHQLQGPAGSCSPPNPSLFHREVVKVHEKMMVQTKQGYQDGIFRQCISALQFRLSIPA